MSTRIAMKMEEWFSTKLSYIMGTETELGAKPFDEGF